MSEEYRPALDEARQAGLVKRHETRQERAILRAEWLAQEDDTIGGWCITDASIPGTPADGNPNIASFAHATVARHMAAIHNIWLANQGYLPVHGSVVDTIRIQVAEEIAQAIEGARIERRWNVVALAAAGECASIARAIGSKEASA